MSGLTDDEKRAYLAHYRSVGLPVFRYIEIISKYPCNRQRAEQIEKFLRGDA